MTSKPLYLDNLGSLSGVERKPFPDKVIKLFQSTQLRLLPGGAILGPWRQPTDKALVSVLDRGAAQPRSLGLPPISSAENLVNRVNPAGTHLLVAFGEGKSLDEVELATGTRTPLWKVEPPLAACYLDAEHLAVSDYEALHLLRRGPQGTEEVSSVRVKRLYNLYSVLDGKVVASLGSGSGQQKRLLLFGVYGDTLKKLPGEHACLAWDAYSEGGEFYLCREWSAVYQLKNLAEAYEEHRPKAKPARKAAASKPAKKPATKPAAK